MMKKNCAICGHEFKARGVRIICCSSQCSRRHKRALAARWKAENPERAKETNSRWKSENKDRVKSQTVRWRAANPRAVRQYVVRRLAKIKAHRSHIRGIRRCICGVTFRPRSINGVCCSTECRRDLARKRSSEWRALNPERHRENNRRWSNLHRDEIRQYRSENREKIYRQQRARYKAASSALRALREVGIEVEVGGLNGS